MAENQPKRRRTPIADGKAYVENQGGAIGLPEDVAQDVINLGGESATQAATHDERVKEWARDNLGLSAAAGLARGAIPFSDQMAIGLGITDAEQLKALRDASPLASGIAEMAGLGVSLGVGPLSGLGRAAGKAGARVAAGTGSKTLGAMTRLGIEGQAIGAQQALSDIALEPGGSAGDQIIRMGRGLTHGTAWGAGLGLFTSGVLAPISSALGRAATRTRRPIEAIESELAAEQAKLAELSTMATEGELTAESALARGALDEANVPLGQNRHNIEAINATRARIEKLQFKLSKQRGATKGLMDSVIGRAVGRQVGDHIIRRAVGAFLGYQMGGAAAAVAGYAMAPIAKRVMANAAKSGEALATATAPLARATERGIVWAATDQSVDDSLRNFAHLDPMRVRQDVFESARSHMSEPAAMAVADQQGRLADLLKAKLPQPEVTDQGRWSPDSARRIHARRLLDAAISPDRAARRLFSGRPFKEDVEVLRAIDPETVAELTERLRSQAVEQIRIGNRLKRGQQILLEQLTDGQIARPLHDPKSIAMFQQMHQVKQQTRAAGGPPPSRGKSEAAGMHSTRTQKALERY